MTDVQTPKIVEPDWHRTPSAAGWSWIAAMFCKPDMKNPDHFIITMDGPRGGEHARITVSRQALLEMIVAADKERERVQGA